MPSRLPPSLQRWLLDEYSAKFSIFFWEDGSREFKHCFQIFCIEEKVYASEFRSTTSASALLKLSVFMAGLLGPRM